MLLRLLGHPVTLAPFLLGTTAMTALWILDGRPALGVFAGLAGALFSAGAFLTRLVFKGEVVTQDIQIELERLDREARQKSLDALDERLASSDKDSRPETALRDLRALYQAFQETQKAGFGWNVAAAVEIRARVDQLFDQCVQSLEKTESLWQTTRQLRATAARKPLLDQREKIIEDVQASIKQLSDTLVAIQHLRHTGQSTAELSRIRDELDQSLSVAKRVEARIDSLVKEVEPKELKLKERGDTL